RIEVLVERLDAPELIGGVVHRRELAAAEEGPQLPDARVAELVGTHDPLPPLASKCTAGSTVRIVRLSRARMGRSALTRKPRTKASRFGGMARPARRARSFTSSSVTSGGISGIVVSSLATRHRVDVSAVEGKAAAAHQGKERAHARGHEPLHADHRG